MIKVNMIYQIILTYLHTGFIKLWEPFHSALPNFSINDLPKKLKKIENIPMDNLIAEIKTIKTVP